MKHSELDELKKRVLLLTEEVEDLKHDKRSFRASNDRLIHDLDKMTEELTMEKEEIERLHSMLDEERTENGRLLWLVSELQGCKPATPDDSVGSLGVTRPKQLATKSASLKVKPGPSANANGKVTKKRARSSSPDDADTASNLTLAPNAPSERPSEKALGKRKQDEGHRSKKAKIAQWASSSEAAAAPSRNPSEPIPPSNQGTTDKVAKITQRRFKEGQALFLPPIEVQTHLGDPPPAIPSPRPSPLTIARNFMIQFYGGSASQAFQTVPNPISDHATLGTHRKVFYPNFELNPCVPISIGTDGLLLGKEELGVGKWSIFSKTAQKNFAEWMYVGEYEAKVVGTMTKEQFCAQKESVQQHWVEHVAAKKYDCYLEAKAIIHAWKSGEKGAEDDADWQIKMKQMEQDFKTGKLEAPTTEEIKQA